MKKVEIEIPEGKELKLIDGVYQLVDEQTKVEVGKWYVHPDGDILFVSSFDEDGNIIGYGWRDNGEWFNTVCQPESSPAVALSRVFIKPIVPASHEQVVYAFEKEAVKRFGEDWQNAAIKYRLFWMDGSERDAKIDIYTPGIQPISSDGITEVWNKYGCIFTHGKWAEPKNLYPKSVDEFEPCESKHFIAHGGILCDFRFEWNNVSNNTYHTRDRAEQMKAFGDLIRLRDEWWRIHGAPGNGSLSFGTKPFVFTTKEQYVKFSDLFKEKIEKVTEGGLIDARLPNCP